MRLAGGVAATGTGAAMGDAGAAATAAAAGTGAGVGGVIAASWAAVTFCGGSRELRIEVAPSK